MINIYFGVFIMVISFNCFTITYRYNGVNRTFNEIPRSLFETSIPLISEKDKLFVYFNKEELIDNLTYYFDTQLSRYTDNYTLDYYFSNANNQSMCLSDYCTAVDITLDAKIFPFSEYHKSKRFSIRSADEWMS